MSFEKVYLFTLPLYCRQFILLNILYSLHQKTFALIQHLQERKRDESAVCCSVLQCVAVCCSVLQNRD